MLPLYLVFGLASFSLVAFTSALLGFSFKLSVLSVPLISLSIIAIKKRHNVALPKSLPTLKSVIPLSLLVLSMLVFSFIMEQMKWCSPGDPISHGTITSLILYNDKLPSTFAPISNSPFQVWQYPLLFHIPSAMVSTITGTYPGQAMLVLGGLISVLIPSLLYSIVYVKTESVTFSLLSYTLAFMIPIGNLLQFRNILFSNFLNGTYPNHLANLFVIAFFGVALVKFNAKTKAVLMGMLAFAVALCYYVYIVLIGLYCLYVLLAKLRRFRWLLLAIISMTVIGILFLIFFPTTQFWATLQSFRMGAISGSRQIILATLSPTFCILIFATVTLMLIQHKHGAWRNLVILAIFLLPIFLSLNDDAFILLRLWVFPTRRMWPVLCALTAIMFAVELQTIHVSFNVSLVSGSFKIKGYPFGKTRRECRFTLDFSKIVCLALIYWVILASIISIFAFTPGEGLRYVDEHLQAGEWIANNLEPSDLVLNDRSFSSLFLPSFRVQRVVNEVILIVNTFSIVGVHNPAWSYANRSLIINKVLDNPRNYSLAHQIFSEYDIKYVYVCRHECYADYWHPVNVSGSWDIIYNKVESPESYLEAFDGNPYLETVFATEHIRIFKVRIS